MGPRQLTGGDKLKALDALHGAREAATSLAAAEGLPAHGSAIDIRFTR